MRGSDNWRQSLMDFTGRTHLCHSILDSKATGALSSETRLHWPGMATLPPRHNTLDLDWN